MKRGNERGSFTVEAALALPIFMFAFLTITSLATAARAESITQYAIDQTAKEISQYCYIAYRAGLTPAVSQAANDKADKMDDAIQSVFDFSDTLQGNSGGQGQSGAADLQTAISNVSSQVQSGDPQYYQKVGKAAQDLYAQCGDVLKDPKGTIMALAQITATKAATQIVSRVIAQPLCRALVPKYITSSGNADALLKNMGVDNGLDGLNFNLSTFLMDERTINVVVVYQIKLNGFGVFPQTITVKQTACTAAWIQSKSLAQAAEESYWSLPPLERGKMFAAELRNEDPQKAVKAGKGIDLYDESTNTFTAVYSMDVYAASYSDFDNGTYTLKESEVKNQVRKYAEELQKSVQAVDVNLEMNDGRTQQTALESTKHREMALDIAVPDTAGADSASLNEIAEQIRNETGVTVNWTYRK